MNKIKLLLTSIFWATNCFGFPKDCKPNDFACNPIYEYNTGDILYILSYSDFMKFTKDAEIVKTMPTPQELVKDGMPDKKFPRSFQRIIALNSLKESGDNSWSLLKCEGVAVMNHKIYFWKLLSRSWLRIIEASDRKTYYPLEGCIYLHLTNGISKKLE